VSYSLLLLVCSCAPSRCAAVKRWIELDG
jgi:hypothetical protein